MDGKRRTMYLKNGSRGPAPVSAVLSLLGFAAVLFSIFNLGSARMLFDLRSLLVVVGGSLASLLFQYDLWTLGGAFWLVLRSFGGTPEQRLLHVLKELDEAILQNAKLDALRDGRELTGELLNDVVYMVERGLFVEEIEAFLTSRIAEEFLRRKTAAGLLRRAAVIAPAFGLFGTVIGLIGVLHSLDDPKMIGSSMALALMTTAYGAGMSSLLFSPMAGRLETHNTTLLEVYKRVMRKVEILLHRDERRMDSVRVPEAAAT